MPQSPLTFKTCNAREGYFGAFVAEHDGYMCFLEPVPTSVERDGQHVPRLMVRWTIQQGGGWTFRGGPSVETLAEDMAHSISEAESRIQDWLLEQSNQPSE